jgi:hypothetical protein
MDAIEHKVYKVGADGPSGGWVFFDKGEYSGGWRYLETFPKNLGRFSFEQSKKEVNRWKHAGWRLPTKEELDLIYKNVTKGRLKSGMWTASYWSSTTEILPPWNGEYIWIQDLKSGKQEQIKDVVYGQAGYLVMPVSQF